MKMLSVVMISFLLFMGCSKDDTLATDCTKSMLDERDMIEYNGQEIGCKFFLELYYYQDNEFFLLGSHCADMISYPIDCEGNFLCKDPEDTICKGFYANSERIGIIGVDE